jgi:ribose transport system permease protein
MLTGYFDISLGRMVCLTSCVGALLMKNLGAPVPVGILCMFLVGILVGSINGFLVSYIGVPAMIATLGTQYICFGVSKLITQAVPIPNMPASIAWLGRGYIANQIPICTILMICLYIIAQLLLTYTKVGRNIFAVGGSAEAAFFSGINVKLYKFGTFILASITATFGGLVLMSRLNSVAVTNGQNYEFDAVISSIIGGISLAGGKGNVVGTMFGCIFLITLFNGFSMIGIDPFVQDVLKGVVLISAITLDVMNTNKTKKH